MIKLTNRDIGKTILVEGQFPVIINYIKKENIPGHECEDGSFFEGFDRILYSDDGSGWYSQSKSDRWEQEE